MASRNQLSTIEKNRNSDSSIDINVLLMGQTGVGKSTFINAFAHYLCNDTLEEAINDKMQVLIPSAFSFTHEETFEEKRIQIGEENEYEKLNEDGQTCTQQCRSFVFPVGKKNLRIIDTPGIGDTRGLEQDTKNFHEILTFISQYEHLNGICILLRPNEERLTILFRFCVNELLRHLHESIRENIIFVFTNARSTFFAPGSTSKILRGLLNELKSRQNVEVPFTRENSFLLDNEPFRYLALRRNGIELSSEQKPSYEKSWYHSIKEYSNLMGYITTRPLHVVSGTLSLNEAEQLIRKLTRPIAEAVRLIQQNVQFAKTHQETVLKNPDIASQGLPQNDVRIKQLKHPRIICVSEKCCKPVTLNNEVKIEYTSKCHETCYCKGILQDTISDPSMKECETMDHETGKCTKCGCSWKEHQHITYKYETNICYLNKVCSSSDIDKQISDLKEEQAKIEDIYKKLSKFLYANAVILINDDILKYYTVFIKEEQLKNKSGCQSNDVIQGLEQTMKDYATVMNLFKDTVRNEKDPSNSKDILTAADIFPLVEALYRLPINGQKIREQVNSLKISQENLSSKREVYVELSVKAESSTMMDKLKNIISNK
ncbi:unnamed protein product [Rotaria sp. Silwood2]|nr:unnamed protein product [Rotaria sp. Silwood2]CAF2815571.1 unnamed protein product [Rotaria sp. Silwood2]CAF3345894.1 unnamed protein product [Rotaria sp. Silwood2]CAF3994724.1 unnamed protein product [Rotaria sp. Silwood2]CAF4001708.1 unnamed protein product [Rotaria sp. Silwood2]